MCIGINRGRWDGDYIRSPVVIRKKTKMGHFHKLLCEEMIFPLLKGKVYGNAIPIIRVF